jgi:hypothetical protein
VTTCNSGVAPAVTISFVMVSSNACLAKITFSRFCEVMTENIFIYRQEAIVEAIVVIRSIFLINAP